MSSMIVHFGSALRNSRTPSGVTFVPVSSSNSSATRSRRCANSASPIGVSLSLKRRILGSAESCLTSTSFKAVRVRHSPCKLARPRRRQARAGHGSFSQLQVR